MLASRRSWFILSLLALLLVSPHAVAQEVAESHLRVAEELLTEADTEGILLRAIDEVLAIQLEQNPMLHPFEDVLRDFYTEHLGWEAIRDQFVRLYAAAFTEDELRELAAFYRTPTGQKALRIMPTLMAQGMQMGHQAVQDNLPELELRIRQRARELQQSPKPEGKDEVDAVRG